MSLSRKLVASTALALSTLVLCPTIARADVRTEARRHFRSGMALLESGDIETGVRELEAAYRLMPHANVLFNIARAYYDAGNYVQAILYYERYLEGGPPDREAVRQVVDTLRGQMERQMAMAYSNDEEQGRADTAKGGAAALTVTPEVIQAIRNASAQFEEIARVTHSEPLLEQAKTLEELAIVLNSGAPRAAAHKETESALAAQNPEDQTPAPAPKTKAEAKAAETDVEVGQTRTEDIYEERVVSASRLSQSPLDAPNSTTMITSQDIRLTGITHIGELLRRVAGLEVMSLTPSDTQISIRGLNRRLSNKVLVLIDGRSVFLDFMATTLWPLLPIAVEDIERIEVIRGPASALYGADAYTGVVNVLLKEPGKGRSMLTTSGGEGKSTRATALFTGRSGDIAYRFGTGFQRGNHYSLGVDPDRVDIAPPPRKAQLGIDTRWINTDLSIKLGDGYVARIGSALQNGYLSFLSAGRLRNLVAHDTLFLQTHANLSTPSGLTLRSFWNAFLANVANAEGAVSDISVDTQGVQSHAVDLELEYADQFDLVVPHSINIGIGYRTKSIQWDWLDTEHTEHHFSAFLQDRLQLTETVKFGVSARVDKHPLFETPVVSPRGSFIVRLTEHSAARATIGTAFRSPAFLESYLNNEVPTPIRAVTAKGVGDEDLQAEQIISMEVGYTHQGHDYFALEANLYYNLVDNQILLSDIDNYRLQGHPGYNSAVDAWPVGELQWSNERARYRQLGGELGIRVFPVNGLDLYANYSYHDTSAFQTDADILGKREDDHRTSTHKLNGGIQYRSRFGFDAAVDVHAVTEQDWVEQVSCPESGSCFQTFNQPSYVLLNARVGYRVLNDRLDLGIAGTNLTGYRHRQHPFGEKLERRIYATVALRF